MSEIEIDLRKSLNENASGYFERSKKAKKKLEGILRTMPLMEKKLERDNASIEGTGIGKLRKKRRKEWYEKFHWFFTSDGMLAIAGKDAKGNDALVKKHMEKTDIYFHAEIHGAPHTVLKSKDNTAPPQSMQEAAEFAGAFSSAWKQKLSSVDVYSVLPEQVSKSAPTGESMGAGAFMIYGKRQWFRKATVRLAIGFDNKTSRVVSGPEDAIRKTTSAYVAVSQGDIQKGEFAKKIKKELEFRVQAKNIVEIDEILSMLPAGGFDIG